MHECHLRETCAFSDVSPMAKVPDEKRKKLFELSIRMPLLECLPGMQYKVLDLDNGDIHYV
jgi:hypothetical protein